VETQVEKKRKRAILDRGGGTTQHFMKTEVSMEGPIQKKRRNTNTGGGRGVVEEGDCGKSYCAIPKGKRNVKSIGLQSHGSKIEYILNSLPAYWSRKGEKEGGTNRGKAIPSPPAQALRGYRHRSFTIVVKGRGSELVERCGGKPRK